MSDVKATLVLAFSAALLLAGCATQTREQLAAARAADVSAAVMHKLERWGSLSPADIIELKRRHVNDAIALRQLDRAGVDYVVDKSILKQLRKAGVSETVVSAVILAGRRFVDRYYHPGGLYEGWYGPAGYAYDPFYYDLGWPYPRSYYVPLAPPGHGPVGPGPAGLGGGPPPPRR